MHKPHAPRSLTAAETKRWTRIGKLAALCMLLGYAETFVPLPIPGVKLGLANIPILVALAEGDVVGATGISAIKVLATGLLFGSPLTIAYSAAGTLLALCGMAPLSRLKTMRLWMLSIIGALLHEAGQLAVATAVLGTTSVWYASPPLIVAGCITGALCGALAQRFMLAMPEPDDSALASSVPQPQCPPRRTGIAFFALVCFVIGIFHVQQLVVLAAMAGVLALCLPREFLRSLRFTLVMGVFTLVMQYLVQPSTALADAGIATLRLCAIATASLGFMRLVPTDDLPGMVAWLVSPLSRLGIRTEGFTLAFAVAISLLPHMANVAREEFHSKEGQRIQLGTVLHRIMRRL